MPLSTNNCQQFRRRSKLEYDNFLDGEVPESMAKLISCIEICMQMRVCVCVVYNVIWPMENFIIIVYIENCITFYCCVIIIIL